MLGFISPASEFYLFYLRRAGDLPLTPQNKNLIYLPGCGGWISESPHQISFLLWNVLIFYVNAAQEASNIADTLFPWKDNTGTFLFNVPRAPFVSHNYTSARLSWMLNIIAANYNKKFVLLQVIQQSHPKQPVLPLRVSMLFAGHKFLARTSVINLNRNMRGCVLWNIGRSNRIRSSSNFRCP